MLKLKVYNMRVKIGSVSSNLSRL